jgi:ABC-2 type transport system permease protein
MKKYLSLYGAFFRASLTADLEFRANFAIRIITDIFWYAAQIISFELLFNYSNEIGDWNRQEMRVFLGVLFIVDAIYMILFSTNLDMLSESVRKGNLDLLLTKPVNSQFMISFQRASTAYIGNLALAAAWLGWALYGLEAFSWGRLVWLLITVPSGVMIFYSLRFLFSACAVIFARAENLQYLWYHIYKLGLRPDGIYFPWLKIVILTAIPVGLIASAPSRVVLGSNSPWLVLWCAFVALLTLKFSNLFWKFALSKYTSASS